MPETSAEPILTATQVGKRFGALRVLDDVSFTMHANEAVGIVGPNGAGKTTFLSVLVGALSPGAGTVSFMGQDITYLPAADRCRKGLVRTHQIPRPFLGMTVFENAFVAASSQAHVSRDKAFADAIAALELTGMLHIANRRGETLGLLDRKRLELARALATGPKALLLDEIGGGLSEGEADELVGIIKELRQRGIAIAWIEHIVHLLLQVTDRLICMDAGKVIADGKPEAVMSDPVVVAAYLGGVAQ